MKTPEVRIFLPSLLYDSISIYLDELWNKDDKKGPLATPEECEQYAEDYRQEWVKYADKIPVALTKALGIEFYRNVIDAACVPCVRATSDPLTLNFHNSPDKFVDALTHELCNVLLTDNTVYAIHSSEERIWLAERWTKLFGDTHDFTALVHIPVHALCQYIYVDVLKEPSRLERDKKDVGKWPAYKAAWEYVDANGYEKIIAQLRDDYAVLQKELQK
jgi:hypothetical protein